MAKRTKKCKVCGVEYTYCLTKTSNDGERWQDVACCVEHAAEFFAQLYASRNQSPVSVADDQETPEIGASPEEPILNEFSADALSVIPAEVPVEETGGETKKRTKKKKQTNGADF